MVILEPASLQVLEMPMERRRFAQRHKHPAYPLPDNLCGLVHDQILHLITAGLSVWIVVGRAPSPTLSASKSGLAAGDTLGRVPQGLQLC
jgi:hypothetical protein